MPVPGTLQRNKRVVRRHPALLFPIQRRKHTTVMSAEQDDVVEVEEGPKIIRTGGKNAAATLEPEIMEEDHVRLLPVTRNRQTNKIVERWDNMARAMPSTFKYSLRAQSWNNLHLYASSKGLPVRCKQGRADKSALVEAIERALQEQVVSVAAIHRPPKKGLKGGGLGEVRPHDNEQAFFTDIGEIRSGNDNPVILARVRATLAHMVKQGTIDASDARDMEQELLME